MHHNRSPLVSVLIPTLNEVNNIQKAINSIKSQTFPNVEILVCDGGSTDGTVNTIQSNTFSDIQIFIDTNGLMSQYNTLCEAADGKYLAILDADSVMLPKKLEKQVQILEENPNVGAVGTSLQFDDRDGNKVREITACTGAGIKWTAIQTNPICHTTALFRRKAVEEVGGYRNRPFGDYDLTIRLAKNWDLINIDEPLTRTLERESRGGRTFSPITNLYHNSLIGASALLAMDWKATELPVAILKRVATSAYLAYKLFPKV